MVPEQVQREINRLKKRICCLENAEESLIPDQSSNNGKFLTTDGTSLSWGTTGAAYKVYTALLTQSSTNPPVATVLQNTLPETPNWIRAGGGDYGIISLGSIYDTSKTVIILGPEQGSTTKKFVIWSHAAGIIEIKTFDNTSGSYLAQDGLLLNTFVEIRLYP